MSQIHILDVRSCKRLKRLVLDREVWRWLLQGITDFTEEKVDELVGFAVNRGPEVMGEVLRAAARSFEPFNPSSPNFPGRIQLSVSVDQGWGGPDTFKLAEIHLNKLDTVAEAVGAKYNIVEVDMAQCLPRKRCEALKSWSNVKKLGKIVNHMEEQTEKMDMLKLCAWDHHQYEVSQGHFLSLLKVTKKWRILYIMDDANFLNFFADLPVDIAAAGQIESIWIRENEKSTSLDVLKRIWEISVTLIIKPADTWISVEGGKGENPEAGRQQFLDYLQILHGN